MHVEYIGQSVGLFQKDVIWLPLTITPTIWLVPAIFGLIQCYMYFIKLQTTLQYTSAYTFEYKEVVRFVIILLLTTVNNKSIEDGNIKISKSEPM